MHLSVYVFGLEDFESRELEEILSKSREVEDVSVVLSHQHIRPGEIYASAEFAHYSIKLAEFVIGAVLTGSLSEAGKDLYVSSRDRVRRRLKRWVQARNRESKHERIRFTLTESGEMVILMQAAEEAEPLE